MFRFLFCLMAFTLAASAQVALQSDETLQEQIIPESFVITGDATASKINWFWRTNISYSIVNKTGINLYMGVMQGGVSLGSCGDVNTTQGGLPQLPSPTAVAYSAPAGSGPPRAIFVPASGKTSGLIVLNNCAAPNPGFPTAPLSLTLMMGKANDWKHMVTLSVNADIPIRQLAGD
jgi:hypothetical protein